MTAVDQTRIWLTTLGDVDARLRPQRQVADHPSDPQTPVWVFIYDGYRPPIQYVDESGNPTRSKPETRVLHVVSAVDQGTREGGFIYIYGWSELGSPELPETMPTVLDVRPDLSP